MVAMSTTTLTGPFDTRELPRIGSEPVTVTVARTIRPGQVEAFEDWSMRVQHTLARFPGFLGAGVLRPGEPNGEYQIVFRFTDPMSLRLWERSPQRAGYLAELDDLVVDTRVQRTLGTNAWFEAAEHAERRPRWKRLASDVLWVYPVSLTMSVLLAPALAKVPLGARVLLMTSVMTIVLAIVVGPVRRWNRKRRTL
jgi:antibiotic biosynthesis monooxygenase (ABM) superfamily enzyme